ncbi:MAG: dihydroorotate dehydrogenase electron transfer subunit [Clostridia bacterium]|nr:dihydroorotate dehydrogenase electron transfer subunit [Clostridia bacterium]
MHCGEFRITAKERILPDHCLLQVEAPEIAQEAQPGQFVQIRCGQDLEPLLRRPISIHRVTGECLSFLFRIVGRGTQKLAEKQVGDKLDILGALGQGFRLPETKSKVALIGGGIGVAPLVFLADSLNDCQVDLLAGAARRDLLLPESYFSQVNYYPATDDGSWGYSGLVTDLLKSKLQEGESYAGFYACGPLPMLKALARLAQEFGLKGQISLEEKMGCGLGVCLSCVTKIKDQQGNSFSHQRICREGPVFDWQEVKLC